MANKEVANVPSQEMLDALKQEFPQEQGFDKVTFPRLSFKSQDVTEGKGKSRTVVMEAGTFLTEKPNDAGEWEKEEIGTEIEGKIIYKRRQLKMYDEDTEEFSSTPIFDDEDEILPLFCNKKEVARGTPQELKDMFPKTSDDGKKRSKLEENIVLYIVYNDELHEMSLRGSSMYSFKSYARKTNVPAVLTRFTSEPQEKGSIEWNQMQFEAVRQLDADEIKENLEKIAEIKDGINQMREFFASRNQGDQSEEKSGADEEFEALAAGEKE